MFDLTGVWFAMMLGDGIQMVSLELIVSLDTMGDYP